MAEQSRARRRVRWLFIALTAGFVALGFVMRVSAPEPEVRAVAGSRPLEVQTLRVATTAVQGRVEVPGLLEAKRRVELFAEVQGRVLETGAEALDRVADGQLLLRVDPLVTEVQVARAEAALARAQSELSLARSNLDRQGRLKGRQVSSESELDAAKNAERVAAASVRESRASLEEARDRLAKAELRAPFAGFLREFPVEAGEYLQPGEEVAELLDTSAVRVTVGLGDREIVLVEPGLPAILRAPARPGEEFRGRVLRVGGASDTQTKKFPVQVEVPNDEGRLLPGMVVRVQVELGEPSARMLVPRDAIQEEFGLAFVYVIEPGAEATVASRRRVEVRDVPFLPSECEIVEGLEPGEEIAVSAVRQLREGTSVVRSSRNDSPRIAREAIP